MQQTIRRDLLMTQRQTLCQTVSKSWHENNCSGFLKTLSCLRYLNWAIIHFSREVKQVRAKRDSRAGHTYLAEELRLVDPLEKWDTRPRLSLRIQSSTCYSVPGTFRRFVSPANLPCGQERREIAVFVGYPRLEPCILRVGILLSTLWKSHVASAHMTLRQQYYHMFVNVLPTIKLGTFLAFSFGNWLSNVTGKDS